jgi:hypothetical protein
MSGQHWVSPVGVFQTRDYAAVTASATLTDLCPNATNTAQVQLAAVQLQEFAGKEFEIQAWGHYTTTASQGTITAGPYSGTIGQAIGSAAAVAVSPALTWVASQTNRFWHVEGVFQVRDTGTTGACMGFLDLANFVSGATDVAGAVAATAAGATVAIDTTVARYLTLGVTLSVASQSITCRRFRVRSLN